MPPGFHSDSDRDSLLPLLEVNNGIKQRRQSISVGKYRCSIDGCQESFLRLDHLDRHEYKHTGVKRHACHYEGCDKSYSILTHLKRHVSNTHERTHKEPNRSVPCELDTCSKYFTSLTNMRRHMREVHENPKLYKCIYCDESFKQKLKMRRHEITKHSGVYPFVCDKCGKGFHQQNQLQKHSATCKIYICDVCDTQFDKWSLLRKHCKEQQHVRKYKCESCERIYSRSGELKNHMAIKHFTNEDKPETNTVEFKCPYDNCPRMYSYERNLRHHIVTAHKGKRFECSEFDCDKSFTSAQNLQKHLKRDHVVSNEGTKNMTEKSNGKTGTVKKQKRKDAGSSRISRLAKLSLLAVDKELNQKLSCRDPAALADVSELLTQAVENEYANISENMETLTEQQETQILESVISLAAHTL